MCAHANNRELILSIGPDPQNGLRSKISTITIDNLCLLNIFFGGVKLIISSGSQGIYFGALGYGSQILLLTCQLDRVLLRVFAQINYISLLAIAAIGKSNKLIQFLKLLDPEAKAKRFLFLPLFRPSTVYFWKLSSLPDTLNQLLEMFLLFLFVLTFVKPQKAKIGTCRYHRLQGPHLERLERIETDWKKLI